MAERNEVVGRSPLNLDDKVEINCFRGFFYPNKIKEKLGKVLPCCSSSQNDSIESQEDLKLMMTSFQDNCNLKSCEQRETLDEKKEKLRKVLNDEKVKYESFHKDSRQFRKKWRDRRIKIYNYILRHALFVTKENEDSCFEGQSFTDDFYDEAFLKLESEQFYTYLVDQVHEDEEIMFKYYCVDKGEEKPFKWREDAKWLVASINLYRDMLICEALDAMRPWEDGNQSLCDNLVKEAIEKFLAKQLNLHGRPFRERSWRNRARFYYIFGLARHTGISNGRAGKFENFDYEGPFCHLVHKMIIEDEDLFDQEKDPTQCLLFAKKTKHKKQNNGFLGCLSMDRLLAWASAANDLGFVRVLLKYYQNSVKSRTNFDFNWEKSVGESWAKALWNASYMGYTRIVQELLSWKIPYHLYYFQYFFDKIEDKMKKFPHEPPLHVAVLRKDASVVDAFCTTASPHLNCNEKNSNDLTPLEIATNLKVTNDKTKDVKRKIQNLLLQRPEVKNTIEEARSQMQLKVNSSNAVMVGGTLIAGITFGGWLQPPLGYNLYYQSVDPTTPSPSPFDSNDSYMSVQGHLTIQLFAIFNSLSFYFAIASVIAGMETFWAIKVVEDIYQVKALEKLQQKLKWATNLFLTSVVCVLVAFSCAGIAVLPPVKKYQTNMYITTAIGGFICMVFICKMLWYTVIPRDGTWNSESIFRGNNAKFSKTIEENS